MPNLKDLHITRLSLVRKPATKKQFLVLKSEEDTEELAKAVHHHVSSLLELLGADEGITRAYERLASLVESVSGETYATGREQMHAVLSFLSTARDLMQALSDVEEEVEEAEEGVEKKELDTETRKRLPKRLFAWVDEDGRGHFPIHDAAHVRNALARFNQGHFPDRKTKARALRKILARARQLGVEYDEEKWKAVLARLEKEDEEVTKMSEETRENTTSEERQLVSISKEEWESVVAKAQAAEVLLERVAKMEEEARRRSYLEKAAKYPLLGDAEFVAQLIRKAEEGGVDPAALEKFLSAVHEQLRQSALLKEAGAEGAPESGRSEFDRLVAQRVQELVSKSNMTREKATAQAIVEVAKQHPDLYEQHRKGVN